MGGDGPPRELGAGLHGRGLPQLPGLVVCLPVTPYHSQVSSPPRRQWIRARPLGKARTVGLAPGRDDRGGGLRRLCRKRGRNCSGKLPWFTTWVIFRDDQFSHDDGLLSYRTKKVRAVGWASSTHPPPVCTEASAPPLFSLADFRVRPSS